MARLPTPLNTLVPTPWNLDMPMMFGKYKGQKVADVMEKDAAYLVWAHENVKFFGLQESLYQQARKLARQQRLDRDGQAFARVNIGHDEFYDVPQDIITRELRKFRSETNRLIREAQEESRTVRYADGSGYVDFGGPCGPLYFDRDGNS
jgi:hypothetical protein